MIKLTLVITIYITSITYSFSQQISELSFSNCRGTMATSANGKNKIMVSLLANSINSDICTLPSSQVKILIGEGLAYLNKNERTQTVNSFRFDFTFFKWFHNEVINDSEWGKLKNRKPTSNGVSNFISKTLSSNTSLNKLDLLLNPYGYKALKVYCEKASINKNGILLGDLCWLSIKKIT